MSARPLAVRKLPRRTWRRGGGEKWVWVCRMCRLEGALHHSLPEAYGGALEHLEEEHLGRCHA